MNEKLQMDGSKVCLSDLSYIIEASSEVKINCIMVLLTSYFSESFAREMPSTISFQSFYYYNFHLLSLGN